MNQHKINDTVDKLCDAVTKEVAESIQVGSKWNGLKRTPFKRKPISFLSKKTPPKRSTRLKIHIDPLDALVSEYIRKKAQGKCERCGRYFGWEKLQACHFHSRRKQSVRFDESNIAACDFGCHQYLDGNPLEKIEFFKLKLGEGEYDLLNSRVRITYPKPDKKLLTLYYKSKIKELDGGKP